MSIKIIIQTVSYQRRVEDSPSGHYETIRGENTQRDVADTVHPTVFDGMLDAQSEQDDQITWNHIRPNIARGLYANNHHGGHDRVVVIDTDNADGAEVVAAMTWVVQA